MRGERIAYVIHDWTFTSSKRKYFIFISVVSVYHDPGTTNYMSQFHGVSCVGEEGHLPERGSRSIIRMFPQSNDIAYLKILEIICQGDFGVTLIK